MKKIFYIVIAFWVACAFTQPKTFDEMVRANTKGTVPFIRVDELQKLLQEKKVLLLDRRAEAEYKVSHLKRAKWVDDTGWNAELIKECQKYDVIVCYCSIGYRSEKLGDWLKKRKVKPVKNLYGGIFAWSNAGLLLYNDKGITTKVHPYSDKWAKWISKDVVSYE